MTKMIALGRTDDGLLVPIAVDVTGKIVLSPDSNTQFATLLAGDVASGNYFQIEADGTFVLNGNATTWRDELGVLLGQRLESPASDIVQNDAEGTITFKDSARYPTDYMSYVLQINHDWDLSDVEFHIHWFQASSANVNWLIEYRWQVNGQLKTVNWTQQTLKQQIFTYDSGTLVQINDANVAIVPPATVNVSDFFQVKLYRDYTNASGLFDSAETSGLDVDALSADMHRKSNMLGSHEEYVK